MTHDDSVPSVLRDDLMTRVCDLTYNFATHTGRLTMPAGCCTDMTGVIALFTAIDADVRRIITVAGTEIDTAYARLDSGDHWSALF